VNWLVARLRRLVTGADLECYWYFATNSPNRLDATMRLSAALREPFLAEISWGRQRTAPR